MCKQNKETEKLLRQEMEDLIADLRSLPRHSTVRKINELVKRTRMCKVHCRIVSHLRAQFGWFGKVSPVLTVFVLGCDGSWSFSCIRRRSSRRSC